MSAGLKRILLFVLFFFGLIVLAWLLPVSMLPTNQEFVHGITLLVFTTLFLAGSFFWVLGFYCRYLEVKKRDQALGEVLYSWQVRESSLKLQHLRNAGSITAPTFILFAIIFLKGGYSLDEVLYRSLVLTMTTLFMLAGAYYFDLSEPELREFIITTAGVWVNSKFTKWEELNSFFRGSQAMARIEGGLGDAFRHLGITYQKSEQFEFFGCELSKRRNLWQKTVSLIADNKLEADTIEQTLLKYLPKKSI